MKNILLVEDDPFLIDIYTTKLKESGFAVDVASDGFAVPKKLNFLSEINTRLVSFCIINGNILSYFIEKFFKCSLNLLELLRIQSFETGYC